MGSHCGSVRDKIFFFIFDLRTVTKCFLVGAVALLFFCLEDFDVSA